MKDFHDYQGCSESNILIIECPCGGHTAAPFRVLPYSSGPVVSKFQWFPDSSGVQSPVVSEFQWFPNSSGFQIPVVSRRPLDLGNHWKLETTGTWNPLESGNHWNLKTTGTWKPMAFGNRWTLEATGMWQQKHRRT